MHEQVKELEGIAKKLAHQGSRYDDIHKHLTNLNANPSIVDEALKNVDHHIADYLIAEQNRSKVLNYMIISGLMLLIGLSITLITYFSDRKSYVLAYGAILGGFWGLKESYEKYKQPIETFLPRPNRMKSKRKFGR